MTHKIIQAELDLYMEKIKIYKNDFIDTVNKGKPCFCKYLILFRFLQNLILNIKFKKVCRIKYFEVHFSDINNHVLFIAKIILNGNKVKNNLENVDVKKYFKKYLNNKLKNFSSKKKYFLDYINFKKTENWHYLKNNNGLFSARYTPDTTTIIEPTISNPKYLIGVSLL